MNIKDKFTSHPTLLCVKALAEYLDFCLENHIPSENSSSSHVNHHILPKALFPEYANLLEFPENSTILSNKNHYIAHSLLMRVSSATCVYSAWFAMSNKDPIHGKMDTPDILLGADEYCRLLKLRNDRQSLHLLELITIEGETLTRGSHNARKGALTMGIKDNSGESIRSKATAKQCNTLQTITSSGETIRETMIRKAHNTMSSTLVDGKTIHQRKAEKAAETLLLRSKRYDIFYADGTIAHKDMLAKDVRKISQALEKSSKESPVLLKPNAVASLKRRGLAQYKGAYAQEIHKEIK